MWEAWGDGSASKVPYKHGNLGLDFILVWFNVIVIKH